MTTLEQLAEDYLEWKAARSAAVTVHSLWLALCQFIAHLPVEHAGLLTVGHLVGYRSWLADQALEPETAYARFLEVSGFLTWAHRQGALLLDLCRDFQEHRPSRRLRQVPGVRGMDRLLAQPDESLRGQRDRLILELLYGAGLRSAELERLQVADVQFDPAGLWVRQGKGNKDRLVPIGEALAAALRVYLDQVRPAFEPARQMDSLLVTVRGKPLRVSGWRRRLQEYANVAEVPGKGLHRLRHAYATHLLEGGAQPNELQHLLGHADLKTTQHYLQVLAPDVKREHRRFHPRARRRPRA